MFKLNQSFHKNTRSLKCTTLNQFNYTRFCWRICVCEWVFASVLTLFFIHFSHFLFSAINAIYFDYVELCNHSKLSKFNLKMIIMPALCVSLYIQNLLVIRTFDCNKKSYYFARWSPYFCCCWVQNSQQFQVVYKQHSDHLQIAIHTMKWSDFGYSWCWLKINLSYGQLSESVGGQNIVGCGLINTCMYHVPYLTQKRRIKVHFHGWNGHDI